MKICEIFEGIQGEGYLVGMPMLFIRLSGCNLNCEYCDSKYHNSDGKEIGTKNLMCIILQSDKQYVCWTGGEPTLQIHDISEVIKATIAKHHTLETNGTQRGFDTSVFHHITISPKDESTAKYWQLRIDNAIEENITVKVVTDLQTTNRGLLKYADYLMPLTTFNKQEDEQIKRRVWDYCIKHNFKYSPRLHIDLWGRKRCK